MLEYINGYYWQKLVLKDCKIIRDLKYSHYNQNFNQMSMKKIQHIKLKLCLECGNQSYTYYY